MVNYAQGSDIKDYICKAIQVVGGIPELAAIAGVSGRAVYAWKKGERYPSRANLARLCQHFEQLDAGAATPFEAMAAQGVQEPVKAFGTPRLRHGKPAPLDDSGVELRETEASDWGAAPLSFPRFFSRTDKGSFSARPMECPESCWVLVPALFSGACSASAALEQHVSWHPFSLDWIPGQRCPVEGLRMMRMPGRGMGDTLGDKDFCLVNTGDTGLEDDGIYVLRHGESLFVKRVCRVPDGCLLRGDNRELAYQDFEISQTDLSLGWEVLGRIIWTGKAI